MKRLLPIFFAFAACAHAANAQQATADLRAMGSENDALAWRAVGRLDHGTTGFCTATLIAPELVLTAAHCVFDPESGAAILPEDLTFKAGLRHGQSAAARSIVQVEAHPDYTPGAALTAKNVRHDVALLRLDTPIPTNELDPFIVHGRTLLSGSVSVVSYGKDRENVQSKQDVCRIDETWQDIMYMDCNVTFGSSGAPVFTKSNGREQIVSVISGMAHLNGKKIAVGMVLPEVVADLRRRIWINKAKPVARINRVAVGSDSASTGAKFVRP